MVVGIAIRVPTRVEGAWILACARVSVLRVKGFKVAGTGNCRMRRLLPTQAGDEPPRYIFLPAQPDLSSRFGKTRVGKVALEIDRSVYRVVPNGKAGITRPTSLTGAPIFLPIAYAGCRRHTKV